MATYRLSLSVAKRSDGRNAVAMAAYRSGAELWSERTGETLDFTRRHGILSSDIVLPDGAPSWASEREELWNRSEQAHRRQDAVIARELQLSLPHELTAAQRREVTLGFAQSIATKYGIAVDTSIHAPSRVGDERNHHAHLLLCTRPFDESSKTGFGNNLRAFDAVAHQRAGTENHVESLRQEWCDRLNDALKRAQVRSADGASVKVDHRAYDRQGVDQEPTVKLGPAASAMERRGVTTERGNANRAIQARNTEREALREGILKVEQELSTLSPRKAETLLRSQIDQILTPMEPQPGAPELSQEPTSGSERLSPARRADKLSASQVAKELNPPDYKRMPWETEAQYNSRLQRAHERSKRQRHANDDHRRDRERDYE